MRHIFLVLTCGFLVACVAPEPIETFRNIPPQSWSEKERLAFQSAPTFELCTLYQGGFAGGAPLSQADFAIYERELRRRGMTARDIELLQRRSQTFGTGQSWQSLQCSVPSVRIVNRSFYPGLGHTWQTRTSGGQFIYLQGDGTEANMRVRSWN